MPVSPGRPAEQALCVTERCPKTGGEPCTTWEQRWVHQPTAAHGATHSHTHSWSHTQSDTHPEMCRDRDTDRDTRRDGQTHPIHTARNHKHKYPDTHSQTHPVTHPQSHHLTHTHTHTHTQASGRCEETAQDSIAQAPAPRARGSQVSHSNRRQHGRPVPRPGVPHAFVAGVLPSAYLRATVSSWPE